MLSSKLAVSLDATIFLNKWPSSEYAVPLSAKERAVFGFSD